MPTLIEAVKQVQEGVIGNAYFAKAWYTNNRKSIGFGKKIPVPSTSILNCGRDLHHERITRIIWFIITGIGSGIGAPVKPVITERMKSIAAAGFWELIIRQKLLHPVADMHLKMTGKHPIHKLPVLNLEMTNQ